MLTRCLESLARKLPERFITSWQRATEARQSCAMTQTGAAFSSASTRLSRCTDGFASRTAFWTTTSIWFFRHRYPTWVSACAGSSQPTPKTQLPPRPPWTRLRRSVLLSEAEARESSDLCCRVCADESGAGGRCSAPRGVAVVQLCGNHRTGGGSSTSRERHRARAVRPGASGPCGSGA
jgi:hypothetical protein